ncbi:hypothetical protein CEP54_014492 [Fusarium duplospermum]|uniref:Heterokaryon incompatibility domain-containing protein n=1 Tax=Fusarium duplospermum TaxID=1325734 RepID=A0A428NVR1_9HYPO|nr:hypothetical protein CEP54_014492 [Fusarium duplospermum]
MSNLLCDICNTMFKGPKLKQSRSGGGVVIIKHLKSLEQLQSGIKAGCAVCAALGRRVASKSVQLETLSSFNSGYLIYDFGLPGHTTFLLTWEIDGQVETAGLGFGLLPLGAIIQHLCQPKSATFNSDAAIQLMRGWLGTCLDQHQKCTQCGKDSEQFQLPTRLLDAGVLGSKGCRLVLTNSDSVSGGYLTLSHSWGSSPFLQLKSETMSALTAGIPTHELPATFRDAVFIAHQLGIRCMWIDSLCIQQDSEEDWVREAPTMWHVYGFALINIVAGHSEGPEDGLFPPRDISSVESLIVKSKWDDQLKTNYLLWNKSALRDDFESTPLTQRGWVFQERLLAPRILQFGKMQVYWRCSELFATEAWPQGVHFATGEALRFGTGLDALDKKASMEIPPISKWPQVAVNTASEEPVAAWERLVAKYSNTKLTYGEDKLVALSGIAKLFQQMFKDRYLAGLWWSPFARLLCWRRDDHQDKEARVRPDYRAPSDAPHFALGGVLGRSSRRKCRTARE